MKITLRKDKFLNSIKAVKGIVSARGVQPILTSILIETAPDNKIKLTTTDLNLSMCYTTEANIEKEGKIAISAKFIEDIITKLPDEKDIVIELNEETKLIKISSEKTKYEVVSLNPDEFPSVFNTTRKTADDEAVEKEFEISTKQLNRGIKQTAFSAVQNEMGGVLAGICFNIKENTLEMVATDGNRLTRSKMAINSKGEETTFITSYRTLIEISKLISVTDDKMVKFKIKGSRIVFEFKDVVFLSSLIEGTYPKYQQLIPTTNEKIATIDREKFLNTIDRVSVMVNSRTNIMKFNFENSVLEISTDTPDAGSAKEKMDILYDCDNLLIAFNYKYLTDCLRNISKSTIKIEMSTNLSAAVVKPDLKEDEKAEDDYICLIMPVQVR